MKLEPFNHSPTQKRWDRFKEFYNNVDLMAYYSYLPPFVHFETGEFIVTRGYYRPHLRKHYETLNISIYNSDDLGWAVFLRVNNLKLTTPDGDEVKRSWLDNHGAQHLWIDKDTRTVTALARYRSKKAVADTDKRIPARLREHALLYYAAPNEQPISANGINVTEVDKLDQETRQHIDTIVAACKAWNTLSEEAQPHGHNPNTVVYDSHNKTYNVNPHYHPRSKIAVNDLLNLDFTSMTWAQRKQVALYGVQSRKKTTAFTHLKLI